MPRVSADPWRRRQVSLLSRYSILSSGSAPLPTTSARAAQPASPILLPSWSRISSFGTTAISGACQAPHSRHGPRGGTRQDTSQQSTITTLAWWLAATLTRHALANAARTRNKELLGMEILTRPHLRLFPGVVDSCGLRFAFIAVAAVGLSPCTAGSVSSSTVLSKASSGIWLMSSSIRVRTCPLRSALVLVGGSPAAWSAAASAGSSMLMHCTSVADDAATSALSASTSAMWLRRNCVPSRRLPGALDPRGSTRKDDAAGDCTPQKTCTRKRYSVVEFTGLVYRCR